jgi:hypothetical protein
MEHRATLETVRQIQQHIRKCAIAVRWFSSEYMHSPTQRRSKRRGAGNDFRGFKEFDPVIDDLRHVDAHASASDPDPDAPLIAKTFFQPMDVRIHVLKDVWHSMHFGTVDGLKSWLGAAAAGCAIYSADKTKDRASLITYSSKLHTVHPAQTASRLEIPALVSAVTDHEKVDANDKGEGGGLAKAIAAISRPQRSIVLVITDFVNISEKDWDALRICGIKNDTIVAYIQDVREYMLPAAPWPGILFDLMDYRGNVQSVWVKSDWSILPGWISDPLARFFAKIFKSSGITTRQQYTDNFKRQEARVLNRLKSYRIRPVIVSTENQDDGLRDLLMVLRNKLR